MDVDKLRTLGHLLGPNEMLEQGFCELWYEAMTIDNGSEDMWKDMSHSDFVITIKAMGWEGEAEFEDETGCNFRDVEGYNWNVFGNPSRVYTC